jgi:hypothetical protein
MPGVGAWRPGPKWILTGAGTSMSFSSEEAFRGSMTAADKAKLEEMIKSHAE